MKKKILSLITAAILLLAFFAVAIACSPDSTEPTVENADYSVTVKDPDGDFVSGITVKWTQNGTEYGSAVTGDDGKASASLPKATYKVELSNVAAGFDFPSPSVTSGMRDITLTLERSKVEYTVTVIDKDGAPAANVTVTWTQNDKTAGTASTDGTGVAKKALPYGDYVVSVVDLPDGNIASGTQEVSGDKPSTQFDLVGGTTIAYSVTLRTEGGLKLKGYTLRIDKDDAPVLLRETDDNGSIAFSLEKGRYTVRALGLPDGYTAEPAVVDADNVAATIVAISKTPTLPTNPPSRYVLGDIFPDYSFTTPYEVDGAPITVSIAETLKTKRMIILNFWGTKCSYCVQEMPAMQSIYERFGDKIEIIAVNNYVSLGVTDSNTVIENFYKQNGYTFPMMRDTFGFTDKFALTGWPTTVIIDRYGAIARIERGGIPDEGLWERLVEMYAGDEYTQTFTPGDKESDSIRNEVSKPDITVPADHYDKMATVLNNTAEFPEGAKVEWYGAPDTEEYSLAWPFLFGTVEEVSPAEQVVYSSNTQKHTSYSVLFANITAPAGSVFTFDYYADTEADGDILSILWDGKVIKEIDGNSDGWKTCKLYVDLTDEPHSLAMTYMKDSSTHVGKDNVYIRNVRFTEITDFEDGTDMLRGAAYGGPTSDGDAYRYYAPVSLGEDGYYYVDKSGLQNAAVAGNDDNPMLFVNLTNATNWSGISLQNYAIAIDPQSGEYLIDMTDAERAIWSKYFHSAINSDIPQMIPVDDTLLAALKSLMQKVKTVFDKPSESATLRENEWLELCYFFSHYGEGEPKGNPIIGLTEKTAIPAVLGENVADIQRLIQPLSFNIYKFTPTESGVYKIYSSEVPETQAVQIWLYDDATSALDPLAYCGDYYVTRDGKGEQNFELYYYLTAGHTYYFDIALDMPAKLKFKFTVENVGASASVLLPAAYPDYVMIVDKDGNPVLDQNGNVQFDVNNPVEFTKDSDGYYRAVNPDGSVGSYIYLDLIYPNAAMGTLSIEKMLDKYIPDPGKPGTNLTFKTFDFTSTVVYSYDKVNEYFTYGVMEKLNTLEGVGERFKDYTARLKQIIADEAEKTGETRGMVKVNDEIKEILDLFMQLRVNMVMYENDTLIFEEVTENEWLRYCWYYRQYDANNI